MSHLHLLLFVGVATGIVIGEYIPYASELAVASFFIFILATLSVIWNAFVRTKELKGNSTCTTYSLLAILFLIISLAIIRMQMIRTDMPHIISEEVREFVVTIDDQGTGSEHRTYEVTYKENAVPQKALLILPLYPEYSIGDNILIRGTVTSIAPPLPTIDDRTPFDYGKWLYRQGYVGTIEYPEIISLASSTPSFTHTIKTFRVLLTETLSRAVRSPYDSLANGVLFGGDLLSKEHKELFRTTGISHIVALSGFNIAVLISFIGIVLYLVPLFIRIPLTIISIILFVMMVGASPSVVRASVMASIVLLSILWGRVTDARKVFFLAATLISVYDPYLLLENASFHLSSLATLGILFAYEPLEKLLSRRVRSKLLSGSIAVTLSATLATMPYIAYAFGSVSLYGILLNIIVVPLVPLLMLVSFLTIIVGFVSGSLSLVVGLLPTIISYFIFVCAKIVSSLPLSHLTVEISSLSMLLMYAIIITALYFITKKENSRNEVVPKTSTITRDVIHF